MTETKTWYAKDVCEQLNISEYTLTNWYRWERKLLKGGEISKHYLPQPNREMNEKGKPRTWTNSQLNELREYQKNIIRGRKGVFGKFTNPLYTKKGDL